MARRQTGGRLRAVLFLGASLAVAGLAVAMVFRVVQSYQDELITATLPEDTVQVVVSAHDLYPGVTIVPEDLKPLTLPPDYVPELVLRQTEEAVGRVPRERILTSEFIREERLADPDAGVGLNAIIPRGMRALAINISDGSAVSGFLNPGNYVDVIITVKDEETGQTQAITMMQAVTVLAVNTRLGGPSNTPTDGNNGGGGGGGRPSVTLALTPEQAEKITHAFSQTKMTLTLRNDIDVTNVVTNTSTPAKLLGGEGAEKRVMIKEWKEMAAKQADGSLIVIRGPQVTTETISNN